MARYRRHDGKAGDGVARAIAMLKADLERTIALLGCSSIRELDGSFVDVPKDW